MHVWSSRAEASNGAPEGVLEGLSKGGFELWERGFEGLRRLKGRGGRWEEEGERGRGEGRASQGERGLRKRLEGGFEREL